MSAAEKLPLEEGQPKSYTKVKVKHRFDDIFMEESYSIEQPLFQIMQESYSILGASGTETYKAVRKRLHARVWAAKLAGIVSFGVAFVIFSFISEKIGLGRFLNSYGLPPFELVIAALAWGTGLLVSKGLSPKRKTSLFKGDEEGEALFSIEPTSGVFFFNREYHLLDSKKRKLIVFKRPFLESIFRIRWHAYSSGGMYLYTAVEDSLLKAIARRYLRLGRLIPMHFQMNKRGGKKFAEFRRRFSIRDKYGLKHDQKAAPAWVILASAILLDTGEGR